MSRNLTCCYTLPVQKRSYFFQKMVCKYIFMFEHLRDLNFEMLVDSLLVGLCFASKGQNVKECIPVGCIPPTAVAILGGVHQAPHPQDQASPGPGTPPGPGMPRTKHPPPRPDTPDQASPRPGTPQDQAPPDHAPPL